LNTDKEIVTSKEAKILFNLFQDLSTVRLFAKT